MSKKPEDVKSEDERREDRILKRMLKTPPKPHKPKIGKKPTANRNKGKE